MKVSYVLEGQFRTIGAREGRAIAGYSAGGFGTANIALEYPELFKAAAPLSPAVYAPAPPADSSATWQDTFLSDGEFDPGKWEAMNWVSFIEACKAKGVTVSFCINLYQPISTPVTMIALTLLTIQRSFTRH
ncbi:MAG: esterase family protein [Gammaproteobacteria bacterium]|nr:esterase family protein [Gammaproteobacteria bacterium]